MIMEAGVTIQTFSLNSLFQFPGDHLYVAEELCISVAKSLRIGPAVRHLFGLWWPEAAVWLTPCKEIDCTNGQRWTFTFKLRFKPPSIQKFRGFKDPVAFDYYFRQMRNDFLSDCIPEMLQHKNKALGLAATDMIREMVEKKRNVEDMKNCYREFLPRDIWKKHRIWLKQPLIDAVEKGWTNSQQNLEYIMGQYMTEICNLVPEYGSEQYTAQVDEDGQVRQVILQVHPFTAQQPGLRLQIKPCKGNWSHVCSIADLYYVSKRNDGTVEVSRRNGIPKYFRFESIDVMHSFVSCLDGYYRLMEKWTFNLCKELPTPSLLELRALKCHGPVGYQFSCAKLKEKRNNSPGSYIIRESSSSYDEFRIDWFCPFEKKVVTVRVERTDQGHFQKGGDDQTFPTLPQFILYMNKHHLRSPLDHCVPASEYDKTVLLLCRPDDQKAKEFSLSECPCTNKCIRAEEIVFQREHEVKGRFCSACPGHLKMSKGDITPVMIKALSFDADSKNIQEFLKQCNRVLHWHCEAVVATLGISLYNPLALVMEHIPLGSLDKYLQRHKNKIQKVDLVEAASYLARALWYLEEHECVHGKIRCHNVLVVCHNENSFRVKLSDPGLLIYSDQDVHWIPPECHSDYSLAAYSTAADVWAFGTTLWEIFSFGDAPHNVNRQMILCDGPNMFLDAPSGCHPDVFKLMCECWAPDPDNRKLPQAAMRDINQTLYEVYNSRRSNSYAMVYPPQVSQLPPVSNCNNMLQQQQRRTAPIMPRHNSFFKSAMQMVLPGVNNNSYDQISSYSSSSEQSTVTVLTEIYPGDGSVPVGQLVSFGSCDSVSQEPPGGDTQVQLDSADCSLWVIDFSHLTMGQILGQGFYGEVCKATLTQWAGLKEETVAVKSIKKSVLSEAGLKDLLREIDIMKNLRHPNIVEIKGLVEEPQPMLVMEYLELGSLLAHLQMYKNKLTNGLLLKYTTDIAEGMWYLEGKHIVHRDLAARNILVASQSHVKISDFGLAQFTENHYYRVKTERNLPIRWYSPESINFGKFSPKSDVWSYGVTLWEMFSLGENPVIPGVSDTKLSKALEAGQRLACPEDCPVEVYRLMRSCWQMDSHARPSFSEILQQLEDLNNELNG